MTYKITNVLIIFFILIICMLFGCSTSNRLTKMSNEEIIRLAKTNSLNSKVFKILAPDGRVINREEVTNYPITDFYNDRFIDPVTDSIIVKIRKIKKSDIRSE